MNEITVLNVRFGGVGDNPLFKRIAEKFKISFDEGRRFCTARGYEVIKSGVVIKIRSGYLFGLSMDLLTNGNYE